MTDLSKLRSLEQIEQERMRLENQAYRQTKQIENGTASIRKTWQGRMDKIGRFTNILGMLMPKVGQGTVVLTLLTRLFRRFRK